MRTVRRTFFFRWSVIAAIAAAGAALLLGRRTASGATGVLYVAPAGADSAACDAQSTPCRTISQAVTNAAAGDSIIVGAGTYTEQVTIAKPLTLSGEQATIDATGHDNGVLLMTNAAGSPISAGRRSGSASSAALTLGGVAGPGSLKLLGDVTR